MPWLQSLLRQWLDRLWRTEPVPEPRPEPRPEPPPPASTTGKAFVDAFNVERANKGIATVFHSDCLDSQALNWCKEFDERGRPPTHAHDGWWERLVACAMQGGEIMAWGQRTLSEAVSTWMGSPGHRANIMNRGYTHAGGATFNGVWCGLMGTMTPRGMVMSAPAVHLLKRSVTGDATRGASSVSL